MQTSFEIRIKMLIRHTCTQCLEKMSKSIYKVHKICHYRDMDAIVIVSTNSLQWSFILYRTII